ncbi:aminodeoxychorismate lyase [Paenibacillus athensensis]|uniref:4-amino-4-deoxychorismate lyase n=1 Tax=Paenibacillus athensensis TaxID=1967502 RepID=A0A4Y8PV91_9BACL|nr:aminodeoxychorismate lyase [Paenibacillus athensensis]MCD1261862.1 aminodeoxychorismate lyase [Paenibacillus athensensis]
MIIRMNGHLCEEEQAVISVYDHGFLYGLGLFETFRTYGGEPFLLAEHLNRLAAGCRELAIAFEPDLERVTAEVAELLRVNALEDGYFRYSVSAGADTLGLPVGVYTQPTEVLYVKALPPRDVSIYTGGRSLQLLKLPRNTPEGLYRLKSFHYMNNILAKRELQGYAWAQGAEGLLLTEDGYLAEGVVSNLFFVKDGVLYTPSLETGILPGITRAETMRLAEQLALTVHEGLYVWEDLTGADEAFLTNSIQEIVPVTKAYMPSGEALRIGSGQPGVWTRKLMDAYLQATGTSAPRAEGEAP